MDQRPDIEALKSALIERARTLADEFIARGHQSRERIIREENERLRLREEREVLAAKAEAERLYRRRAQAGELRVQGKLDQLRWELIQSVNEQLLERLRALTEDEAQYMPVLARFVGQAAASIAEPALIAELNARDLDRLRPNWPEFASRAAPGTTIVLHDQPLRCSGGVLVYCKERRVRVDNTFEGRIERFGDELNRVISERLFTHLINVEELVHG